MIVRDIQPNFLLNAEILFRSEKISERVQEWKKISLDKKESSRNPAQLNVIVD